MFLHLNSQSLDYIGMWISPEQNLKVSLVWLWFPRGFQGRVACGAIKGFLAPSPG